MCSLCSRQPAHRNKMSLPTLRERAWCKVDRLFRRRFHNCPPQPQGEDRRNESGGCTAFANALRTTRSTLFSKFALQVPHSSGSLAVCEDRSPSVYCSWLLSPVYAVRNRKKSWSIGCLGRIWT